jgi:hypothetical protein
MAMLRRSAWLEAGGFSSELDERFGGWEDYDMWLRLVSLGHVGVQVPEILGRYRSHRGSMLTTVNLDLRSVYSYLHARYPTLPWPVS